MAGGTLGLAVLRALPKPRGLQSGAVSGEVERVRLAEYKLPFAGFSDFLASLKSKAPYLQSKAPLRGLRI